MNTLIRRFSVMATITLAFILLLSGGNAHAAERESGRALQQSQPVYALPGVFRAAPASQPYDTELVAANGDVYAIVGETPAVETQIDTLRDANPPASVKVWGTLYPDGRMSSTPEIVVSSVTSAEPAPTPTPVNTQPQATVAVSVLNLRQGPSTSYPVIGSLTEGETCDITGRDAATTWWNLQCPRNLKGWVAAHLVNVTGRTANVPIIVAPPPPAPTPAPPPATCGGWASTFYANRDLLGSPTVTDCVNQINFNWGGGSPYPQMPGTNWSARFERTINVAPGNYQLRTVSDDGVRVWQDGNLVIDNWAEQSPTERSTTVYLTGAHQFRVDYFQGGGGSSLIFSITPTSGGGSGGGGNIDINNAWEANYWNNVSLSGGPAITRGEPHDRYPLDRDWGDGSPVPGVIGNDNWSARWRGRFYFDPGDYTFKARADDGVRVSIDGIRVLDGWTDGHKEIQNTFRGVGSGQHEILIEYYERSGVAYNRVYWFKDTGGGSGGGGGGDGGGPGGSLDE